MWRLKIFKELKAKRDLIFTLIQGELPHESTVTDHAAIQHFLSNIYMQSKIKYRDTSLTIKLTKVMRKVVTYEASFGSFV